MKKKLLSDNFLYGVIVLAMLNNLEHSAEVYHDVMRSTLADTIRWIIAVLAVCIIDLSILAFVVRKKHILAAAYGAGMFAVNIVYHFAAIPVLIANAIASIVFSLMTTHSIYAFSKMLAEKEEKLPMIVLNSPVSTNYHQKEQQDSSKAKDASKYVKHKKQYSAKLNRVKQSHGKLPNTSQTEQQAFMCHVCGEEKQSQYSLNGHLKKHSQEERDFHKSIVKQQK